MLKNRIIPILLLKDGRMIKPIRFSSYRDVGNPITTAKIYDAQRADELMFLDVEASVENRGALMDIIRIVSQECFMPLSVGGGVRTLDDVRFLLHGGADKVVINTGAVEIPGLIEQAALKFGSANIVVSIDAKKNTSGEYEVFIRRGTQATGLNPIAWAKQVAIWGAGEILITAIDKEGTMDGLDLELTRHVVEAVTVPVIASGGVGKLDDFRLGFEAGASGIGASSIFHFTDQSVIKTRTHLYNGGVNIRK